MRSLLRVGTALIMVMAAGLTQAQESQWKHSGSFRFRTEQFQNYNLTGGNEDYAKLQFTWGLTFQPNDMTTVFAQPKFAKKAGDAGTSGSLSDGTYLTMHQAYLSHKFNDSFNFMAGRYEMKYGDELVIGPVGWQDFGRSFDGGKLRYSMDKLWVDLFLTTTTETAWADAAINPQDQEFHGLYVNYSGVPYVDEIDLYYLMKNDHTRVGGIATLAETATGLRIKSKVSDLDVRAEYTMEGGKSLGTTIEKASQYDAELGYTLGGDFKARFAFEAFSADKNYDQLYPTAHKWLGYADLLGRRNINGFAAHINVPWQDFTFGLDYHTFNRTADDTGAYKLNGTTSWGTTGTEKAIGSEIDLTVKYASSKFMDWMFGYSTFSPGAYMKAQATLTNASKSMDFIYLQMLAKF